MQPPLIHIGYHKTATTWLQERVFSNSELGFVQPWERQRIVDDFIACEEWSFEPGRVRARYAGFNDSRRTPVVSYERLSGYPGSGGYDSAMIAGRLAKALPEARVLIVIREQKSLIRSWYAQFVRDGGTLDLERMLEQPQPWLVRAPAFRYGFFCFDRLIAHYQHLFGAEQVLALPFEMLRSDRARFIRAICEFAGRPAPEAFEAPPRNPGIGPVRVGFTRLGNRLWGRNQLAPHGWADAPRLRALGERCGSVLDRLAPSVLQRRLDRRWREKIAHAVRDRYADSNRRTAELIGLDLGQYGYEC